MPEIPNVIGGEVITSEWGNDIRDRTVQRYATVAARTASIPTPTEGDLSYLQDSNLVYVYNGSAWVKLSVPVVTADIADATVTASKLAADSIAPFIHVDTAVSNTDTVLTTSHATVVSLTVNLTTLGWATAKISAWGTVVAQGDSPSAPPGALEALILFGASAGPNVSMPFSGASDTPTLAVSHGSTLTAGSHVVALQAREAGGAALTATTSTLALIAIRTS